MVAEFARNMGGAVPDLTLSDTKGTRAEERARPLFASCAGCTSKESAGEGIKRKQCGGCGVTQC